VDEIGRTWDRHQWVGDGRRDHVSGGLGDELEAWHFSQWIGDPGKAATDRGRSPVRIDTSGGFSGFGIADSGGQRWANGYRHRSRVAQRPVPDTMVGERPGAPS
jgi:hypothetical protein